METSYFEGECFENLSFVEESWRGLRFVDCQFQGCSFERCRLSHCSFSECRFSGCKILEPVCDQSEVRFLELDHCELTNVNWSLLLPMNGFGEPIDKIENCQLKYNFFTEVPLRKFSFLGSAHRLPLRGLRPDRKQFFRLSLRGHRVLSLRPAQGRLPGCFRLQNRRADQQIERRPVPLPRGNQHAGQPGHCD